MASLNISTLADMAVFGESVVNVCKNSAFPALLLEGPLGAGKTALVREIVSVLPGARFCEVASPSFNICNVYSTQPGIMHWDLYRCRENFPDELPEMLDNSEIWNIVEWSGFLPKKFRPANYLDIHLNLNKNSRSLDIAGHGERGSACAAELMARFNPERK